VTRVVISPAAERDLEHIWLTIAADNAILFETHPDTDEGPVDEVEIIRVVDGRRDLTRLF
jgi:plasmid stabilization system protein ParE